MSNRTIWIDFLGNASTVEGKIGHLVAGPIDRDGATVYMVATPCGTLFADWKDVLVQRAPGSEVEHFKGNC